jgi:hypothetical protein
MRMIKTLKTSIPKISLMSTEIKTAPLIEEE